MKPKLIALIASICLIAAAFSPQFVSAQTKFSFQENSEVLDEEIINGDYFATGERIEIDGTVNGDVYAAGGKIIVDGIINGDLLIAAGDVEINGVVNQDVRVAAGTVEINGEVMGNITSFAGSIEVNEEAVVAGGIVTAAGDVLVAGTVGKSIHAAVGNLEIQDGSVVNGDVHYVSEEEATVGSDASVSGVLQRNEPPKSKMPSKDVVGDFFKGVNFMATIASFLTTMLIGWLMIRFFPRYSQNAANIVKTQLGKSLGLGLLTAILFPIVAVLLLITIVGIPISLVLFFAVPLLMYTGRIFVFLAIGQRLLPAIIQSKKTNLYYAFLAGAVLYYVIDFIPFIGGLFKFVVILVGLGAELINRKQTYQAGREAKIF